MIIDISTIEAYKLMIITGFFTGLGAFLGSILGQVIRSWFNYRIKRAIRRHGREIFIIKLYHKITGWLLYERSNTKRRHTKK